MTVTKNTKRPFTISADGTYALGNIGAGRLGIMSIGLKGSGWTGNIKVYAKPTGATDDAETEYFQVDYCPRHLNGSASDSQPVSTTITTDSLIQIDASAMDIALIVTGYGGGSMQVRHAKT